MSESGKSILVAKLRYWAIQRNRAIVELVRSGYVSRDDILNADGVEGFSADAFLDEYDEELWPDES